MPNQNRRLFLEKLFIIIALFGLLSTQGFAASFDCHKAASWVEKTVCSNAELSQLDDELAKSYLDALASLSPERQEETKQHQKQWLKEISQYCKDKQVPDSVKCLKSAYEERITQLKQILIKLPDRIFRNVYVNQSETKETCPNGFIKRELIYPQIENPRDKNEKSWNIFISQEVSDAFENPTGKENECTDIYVKYTVSFSNKHLISLQYEQFWYAHGAAHGYTNRASFNWLLEDNRKLQASDLFDDKTDWITKLVALVSQKLKELEVADKRNYKIEPSMLTDIVSSSGHWVILKDGLGIQFDEYELGSRASPLIKIDWNTLGPYISRQGHYLISD